MYITRNFPKDNHTVNAYMILKDIEQMGISYADAWIALGRAQDILKENRSDLLKSTKLTVPFEVKDIMS